MLREAAALRGITIETERMVVLGTPFGCSADAISDWLQESVREYTDVCDLLTNHELPAQISMLLLRQCVLPAMIYIARTLPPEIVLPHAVVFDRLILHSVRVRLGLPE